MGKIVTLKDKITQENTYPITSIEAISTEDGKFFKDELVQFMEKTNETVENMIALAQAAEESITKLTNLNNANNYQEIIDNLLIEVNENKQKLISLESDYKNIKNNIRNLLTKSDITNNIKGDINKIPTGLAVRDYVADTTLSIIENLINTTTTTPTHSTNTGQILVNEETNEVFISAAYSGEWLKFNATPIQLDPQDIDAIVEDETLIIMGNTEVDNKTVLIPNTEKVDEDTLIF